MPGRRAKPGEAGGTVRAAPSGWLAPPLAAERLAEALDRAPGARVLAVGSGCAGGLPAFAQRGHRVTVSAAPAAAGLGFETGAFDAVVSLFGVSDTADADATAAELLRVCRPGGRIGLTHWPMSSFPRRVRALAKGAGSATGEDAAADRWADEGWVERRFSGDALAIHIADRRAVIRARHPEDVIGAGRSAIRAHPPLAVAFAALVAASNTATDGSLRVPVVYTEIIIARR